MLIRNNSARALATLLAFMGAAMAACIGCNRRPARVHQPTIDAKRAGRLAMEQYDEDRDGAVAGVELERAPALKAAMTRLDQDSDGRITAAEITDRVKVWQSARVALIPIQCRVLLDGKPLPDVLVTYDPEAFLGDNLRPSTGITNVFGNASMGISAKDRPSEDYPSGVQFGLYKVRITPWPEGSGRVPARYNTETTLGQEVAYDDPAVANNQIVYRLKSQ